MHIFQIDKISQTSQHKHHYRILLKKKYVALGTGLWLGTDSNGVKFFKYKLQFVFKIVVFKEGFAFVFALD